MEINTKIKTPQNRIPKGFIAIAMSLCLFLIFPNQGNSEQKPERIKIAVMADVHFENVYGHFSKGSFQGIQNPVNRKYATIRTMDAQLHSTRLFNENYFAFLAALDDAVRQGVKLILLPGDISDDGQPFNVNGLKAVLESYSKKHNITFLATTGNHDVGRPYQRESGKTDFLGDKGQPQPVMSSEGMYQPNSGSGLPVSVSPEISSMGYAELIESLGNYGFLPQKNYLYWETPFSDYNTENYNFKKAVEASSLEKRNYSNQQFDLKIPDASYLVEPVKGLWILAIDANVYIPKENAKADPKNPANYSGAGAGYNLVLSEKKYLIEWTKRVCERAQKLNKTLIAFSHYPMVDFYDGAAESIGKVADNAKAITSRLPDEKIAELFADAGLKIHFGGHLHINDTGVKKTEKGNTLVNVQVPSLSAYIPAYKLITINSNQSAKIETVVMDTVPRFDELFPLYLIEYDHLQKTGVKEIWNKNILEAKNYREFANWHLKELVRLRLLPSEWPLNLRETLTKLSGKDLLIMSLTNHDFSTIPSFTNEELLEASILAQKEGLELSEFEQWNGFDLIYDFYRINSADKLAIKDIGEKRIGQYKLIFAGFNLQKEDLGQNRMYSQIRAFAESFRLLLNGDPADSFLIDLRNGKISN